MALMVSLLAIAGCQKEQAPTETSSAPAPAAPAVKIDPASVASVSGTIKFTGMAPKAGKIDMSQDPNCTGGPAFAETVVAEGGNLANVFVYVKEGFAGSVPAPAEAATLDQHGCKYVPHVLGVVAGQTIKILNSDDTTHNIHPTPKSNREWNESQAPKAMALEKSFPREELMLAVKCNQHPWMKMYVNVVKHSFFAVSGKDGKFEIRGLPPGDYTLAAVHETLGTRETKVTLAAKDAKTAEFSFAGK
ncbi:MAG: carboxypeptidase regulatory-like domain-containing protein [Acidobacteria bacterium]|nr:carboxypeptidase regulatory-like domain-containing protein [Acidobacteriota bacterium]